MRTYDEEMRRFRKAFGRTFLAFYRLFGRVWGKAFSTASAGAFHSCGRGTILQPPVRIWGEHRISLGDDVWVGPGCWLQVVGDPRSQGGVAISIGSGTNFAGNGVVSAAASITIGDDVLFARGIYVSDHSHAFGDAETPVIDQGIDKVAPVVIEDGAWLGENVVVCPGVRIGRGAVVGANSVVVRDIPARSVAVGAPATVVRELDAPPTADVG
jgi:acetyltransferase-like isoleucine patch superfamily enzyme